MREKVWLGVISYQLNNDNFPKFCIELRELRTELNCKLPAVSWLLVQTESAEGEKCNQCLQASRESGLLTDILTTAAQAGE